MVFVVRVDHRELWRSAPPGADDAPVEIEVPVSGIRKLVLSAEGQGEGRSRLSYSITGTGDSFYETEIFLHHCLIVFKIPLLCAFKEMLLRINSLSPNFVIMMSLY
ncbi:MAG: NPCBM/NEW2 domain-containing protein, partial [Bacteroidales bacterium]|nr:NPCBM/NEW2 domain-containing protein [Bacteroidales bacterium]